MDFRSPLSDVTIPELGLAEYVLEQAARRGSRVALIDAEHGERITYDALQSRVFRAADWLRRRGIERGDVIAVCAPNSVDYPVVFLAAAAIGAAVTTMNPAYTTPEVERQLRDSGARLLFVGPAARDSAVHAATACGVNEVVTIGERGVGSFIDSLPAAGRDVAFGGAARCDDLVALPYSSGTTGVAKGVMLTHRNLVANVEQTIATGICVEGDASLGLLPFFHIYGMVAVMLTALRLGATLVVMPRYSFPDLLATIENHRVTAASLVPPILLSLSREPAVDGRDLSSVERAVSGAAPLAEAVARACERRLGCRVRQGYGLTETSPVTHVNSTDPDGARIASSGVCVPNTICRIRGVDDEAPKGPGEHGEIWIRGPQVMRGYLNCEEATADMIQDGWLRTGDIGYCDADGYLYVIDRLKELIKYRGQQVAPAELEALLLKHPAVADVAVIPSPDEEAGEVPKAFVVAAGALDEAEVIAYVADRVAPHKKVRRVEFVDAIPKSASGKILRRVLRERER